MASYGPAVFPGTGVTTSYAGLFPGTAATPGNSVSGDAITPSNNLYPGAGTFAGQGFLPLLLVMYSTDDAATPVPTWTYVPDARVRSFSISRGRETQLQEVDAGTASLVLDNRNRAFDPLVNSAIRPMNRFWLREQFSGVTESLFYGYAESYDQSWPGWGGSDAEVQVSLVDEFKVLALEALPVTSPPRDNYSDVVQADEPAGYWSMDDPAEILVQSPEVPPYEEPAVAGTDTQGTTTEEQSEYWRGGTPW